MHGFVGVCCQDEILRLAGVEIEADAERKGVEPLPEEETKAFRAVYPLVDSIPSPQTGISMPMAATPHFIRAVPEDAELLYNAPETLFDDIVKAEAERISQPEGIRNRIVYDSVGDPFKTEAPVPHLHFGEASASC